MGGVPVPRAGAGICARRRTFFSCVAKKRRQKKATPSLRPLRFATGQTCVGAVAGCAVELALLLRSAARTATASQITKHGRSDAHAHPATAPTQVCPVAKRRGRRLGVAFFCLLFLRRQEKKVRRRAHIPAPALKPGMRPNQRTSPGFDKLNPSEPRRDRMLSVQ